MLSTVERVLRVPGLNNAAQLPTPWLNDLIGEADAGVKQYLKRDIELFAYSDYYSGNDQQDVICRQYPVWAGVTTVAAGSGGVSLPTGIVNVASTVGFHPGFNLGPTATLAPDLVLPSIAVQVGTTTFTQVFYTGTTATSFTGCTGGTGTMNTGGAVNSPVVFYDPQAYWGQAPQAFAADTQIVMGTNFAVLTDGGGGYAGGFVSGKSAGRKSARGLLRRIGGSGQGFVGFYPENYWSGKLGARKLPTWPNGQGNIKVCYTAGYAAYDVPLAIVNACTQLAAYLVRTVPTGAPLQSESLGAYSYSVMTQQTDVPEIGSIVGMLRPHRDSFSMGMGQ